MEAKDKSCLVLLDLFTLSIKTKHWAHYATLETNTKLLETTTEMNYPIMAILEMQPLLS